MKLPQFLQNANGVLCMVRSIGVAGAIAEISKFVHGSTPDYVGFGSGMALIMGAIVAQHFVEGKQDAQSSGSV